MRPDGPRSRLEPGWEGANLDGFFVGYAKMAGEVNAFPEAQVAYLRSGSAQLRTNTPEERHPPRIDD